MKTRAAHDVTSQMVTEELLVTLQRIQASTRTPADKMLAVEAAEADAAILHQLVRECARQRRVRDAQPRRRATTPTAYRWEY